MSKKAISKLADIRKQAGLTQAKLAVLIGVTTNTIQNWEKEDGLSQLEKYLKLQEIFGLDNLKDLFEYIEETDGVESNSKEFSLEELSELRKRWRTDVKLSNQSSRPSV